MHFKGFTLPELVITLLLVLLIGIFFTPPFYDAMRNTQLNACSEQLATHLRYARRIAMAKGLSEEVVFVVNNPGQHSYRVQESVSTIRERDPLDESKELYVILRESTGGPALIRTGCTGILFDAVNLPGGSISSVIFDSNGVPDLTALGTVRLTAQNGNTRTVYVTQGTGAIMVEVPSP